MNRIMETILDCVAIPVTVGDSEVGLTLALDVGTLVEGCLEGRAVGARYNMNFLQRRQNSTFKGKWNYLLAY